MACPGGCTAFASAVAWGVQGPAIAKITRAHVRNQAYLGSAESALACERFRIEHKRWPETLDELVKTADLGCVPPDPCDGQPLRYGKLPDGVVVYSVGFDKKDNDGKINRRGPTSRTWTWACACGTRRMRPCLELSASRDGHSQRKDQYHIAS